MSRQSSRLGALLLSQLPLGERHRATLKLRAFGFFKIPMLFFLSPSVLELNEGRCVVKIPLTRRSKNHLGSMYFAALAAGADSAGGLLAFHAMEKQAPNVRLSLIFKDFHADFLKRAEGDVFFTCESGENLRQCIAQAVETGERRNARLEILATVPERLGSEPVARMTLTVSLKKK